MKKEKALGLRRVWHCWWGWGGIMPGILLWVLGVAGVVCWVIKLPGCEAAGSSALLCSAPGLKWYSSAPNCVQLITVVESTRKGSHSQLDSVANGGERRVYWLLPGISPAGILQRILPLAGRADYCRGILRGEYIAASSQTQCSLQEQPVAAAIKEAAFHLQ